jgi:hypothetical protein
MRVSIALLTSVIALLTSVIALLTSFIAVLTSVTTMALHKHEYESLGIAGDNLETP